MRGPARTRYGSCMGLFIRVTRAEVERNGTLLDLARRERQVAATIAAFRRPVSAAILGERLFGESDGDSVNAVRVAVHRLRKAIAAEAVLSVADGYVLGDDVLVDRDEALLLLARSRKGEAIDAAWAVEVACGLRCDPAPCIARYEWFDDVARSCALVGGELLIAVGRQRLAAGAALSAAELAEDMLLEDPCDEEACALAIDAWTQLGSTSRVARARRRYAKALNDVLGISLTPTVGAPAARAM